jgi:hypothetical protein
MEPLLPAENTAAAAHSFDVLLAALKTSSTTTFFRQHQPTCIMQLTTS